METMFLTEDQAGRVRDVIQQMDEGLRLRAVAEDEHRRACEALRDSVCCKEARLDDIAKLYASMVFRAFGARRSNGSFPEPAGLQRSVLNDLILTRWTEDELNEIKRKSWERVQKAWADGTSL